MYNNAGIVGRLAADPVDRYTGEGKLCVFFTVAVERDERNAEGKKDVDFIECVAYEDVGKFIFDKFRKGNGITLSGRIEVESYASSGGSKRKRTAINVKEAHPSTAKIDADSGESTDNVPKDKSDSEAGFAEQSTDRG